MKTIELLVGVQTIFPSLPASELIVKKTFLFSPRMFLARRIANIYNVTDYDMLEKPYSDYLESAWSGFAKCVPHTWARLSIRVIEQMDKPTWLARLLGVTYNHFVVVGLSKEDAEYVSQKMCDKYQVTIFSDDNEPEAARIRSDVQ
jgi:hypothetical protein